MIKFKTEREKLEYPLLQKNNIKLFFILNDVATYVANKFKKDIVVTEIFRTEEENLAIYGYQKSNVHMYWRGVDLRSSTFTPEEIEDVVAYVNKKYPYDKKETHKTALYHMVDNNSYHFHLQTKGLS